MQRFKNKHLCLVVFFVLMAVTSVQSYAQAADSLYRQVCKPLNYYLEGGTNNDFDVLKKAFHTNATMKFMSADGYKEVNALDFFREKIKPGPPQDRITRIVSVSVSGNAASAMVEAEYEDFTFIDYMNLLKTGEEWKIVGKIFYKRETSE